MLRLRSRSLAFLRFAFSVLNPSVLGPYSALTIVLDLLFGLLVWTVQLSPRNAKRARLGAGLVKAPLFQQDAETAVETPHVPDSVEAGLGVDFEFSDSLGRLSLE